MMRKTPVIVALFLLTLVIAVGCNPSSPSPFDPKALEQIQSQTARSVPTAQMDPLPTTRETITDENSPAATRPAQPAVQPVTNIVRLPLREVIHRTAMNNLSARVEGYNAAIDEARILEAQARFDPAFVSAAQVQRQWQQRSVPSTQPIELLSASIDAGFQQNLESGGQVSIRERVTRYEFDETLAFPPVSEHLHQTDLVFQIQQPLLRDFGAPVNRARITIARNDQKISELDFRNELEKQLFEVERTYWQLALAEKQVQIREGLLRLTHQMLDVLIKRQGRDVTRVQIEQARADLLRRNAELLESRARLGDLSDQLKQIMGDPDFPTSSPVTVLPADLPVEEPIRFVLSDQIETALQNRVELLQQALRINSADVVYKAARNNELPRLDLQGNVDFQGLGQDFRDALNSQDDNNYTAYSVGLQLEVPIGNRAARAITQRTLLQRAQAVDQYKQALNQVNSEVSQAQRAVFTQWDLISAYRRARFAAQDALEAIQELENANTPLTPEFVQLKLNRQSELAQTAQNEFEAAISYNVAIAQLERAKGTLLRYNNVVMKEARGPAFSRIPSARVAPAQGRKK